ncbi:MAG TPA: DUF4262 domain-containing protein [Sphingomonas sp.]|nr:DUF4262 domain-containing protein [Sphingomonas sp.]
MIAHGELNDYEQSIVRHVRESGCHINIVSDPDGSEPPFAYSVGFPETIGQPEVIVFGLGSRLMANMINETLSQCRSGLVLAEGARVGGLLDGFDCVLRAVTPENIMPDYFNSALWYQRRRTGERLDAAFQIVWPGYHDGLFPWEEGVDPSVPESQPALYEKSVVHE